ncbi:hypothetical protein RDABS01_018384 [Bienertia sinuspersici]
MQIKVLIDISKTLRRGLKIVVGENKFKRVGIKYERLGDF